MILLTHTDKTLARNEFYAALPIHVLLYVPKRYIEELLPLPHMSTWSARTRCICIVTYPPQFACILRFNPAVSRNDAMEAIKEATNTDSTLVVLYTALSIGHPWFANADPSLREGEVLRGNYMDGKKCVHNVLPIEMI
jgi:hypothetical protein